MGLKNITESRFLRLLNRHNQKFPTSKLNAIIYENNEVALENTVGTYRQVYENMDKAFIYLVNRFYHNKASDAPKLGKNNGRTKNGNMSRKVVLPIELRRPVKK